MSHEIEFHQRDGPLGNYYRCEICGRTANTAEVLEQKPCTPGVPIGGAT